MFNVYVVEEVSLVIDLMTKSKNKQFENITNCIKTYVKVYRNINNDSIKLFTIIINFEFDCLIVKYKFLNDVFYIVKVIKQLTIRDIKE